MKKTNLTPDMSKKWAELGHAAFIDAFTYVAPISVESFAFHGGTSLKLSWGSPRYSEDLDFILNRTAAGKLRKAMPNVEQRMRRVVQATDPDLKVEIRDKTKEGSKLINYMIVVSRDDVIGSVKVKAEFWQVPEGYLEKYETKSRFPKFSGDLAGMVTQPLPAATLESAYADKLTAAATRPFLKWRDVFDLWWIARRIDVNSEKSAERFLHNVTGYNTVGGLTPADALRKFADQDRDAMLKAADPDIKRWLPPEMWDKLNGDGIEAIIDSVLDDVRNVSKMLEEISHEKTHEIQP